MQQIKGDNFGEDYGDVADAMSEVIQIKGELNETDMTDVTESALTLRDTFDMDVNESIRAVDVMMKTMGVDAQTAFDLITTGAQNGLNRSGELVDNITEYGQLWGQAGFSAEQMFAILENGLDAGAYNLDKVNDYVKEFGNSLADGRIEDNLSSFSAETQGLFQKWKDGEASTSDVFYSVINDLSEMTNQQEALTLASEVWSALGEDNAMQVLTALDDVNDKYKDVKGSMDSLKEVRYSDLESAVSGLGAAVQENLITPIADKALPTVTGLFEKATEVVTGIGDAVNQPKSEIEQFIDDVKISNDEIQDMLDNASQILDGTEADVSGLEAYKQILIDLATQEELSEYQKYQVKNAVDALSGSIPELAAAFEEESGKINLTSTEIARLIENQESLIKQQAYAKASEEAYEALAKNNESLKENAGLFGSYEGEVTSAYKTLLDAQEAQETANKAVEEAQGIIDTTTEAVDKLTKAEEKNREGNDADIQRQEQLERKRLDGAAAIDAETDALKENTEAAKAGAEAQKAAAQSILDTYEGYVSEIESDLQNKINPFDKFDTSKYSEDFGENLSVEGMTENLNSQIEAFENYQESLEAVKEHVGKEISPEFMRYLEDMGLEGKNTLDHILQTFADEEPEKVKELNDRWIEAMNMTEGIAQVQAANKIAYEAYMGELGSSDADFSQLRESIDSAVSSAAEGWSGLADATKAELDKAVQAAQECGIKIPEGLAESIASGETAPEEAIAQLNGSLQGAFDGLSEVAKNAGIGDDVLADLASGIEAGGQDAVDAYSDLVALIAGKSPELQKAIEEGTNADGVKTSVESSVDAGAGAIEDGTSTYKEKSKALGEAIAEGIEESKEALKTAVSSVVQAGADGIGENAETYRQGGADLGAAVSEGLQEALSEDSGAVILDPGSIEEKSGDYETAGRSLGEAVVSGLQETQNDINEALSPDAGGLKGSSGEYQSAGQALGEAFSAGLALPAESAAGSGSALSQAAVTAIRQQLKQIQSAGREQAQAYARALNDAKEQTAAAGRALADAARSAAAAQAGGFYSAGVNMSSGVASGIRAGQSAAINAASNMAAQALAAAKARLQIHSPSQVFRDEVGAQVSKGFAFGISDKASLAGKAASRMSNKVYTSAVSWLSKYKQSHQTSLEDEKYYWQQVLKHTKSGTSAYKKAMSQLNNVVGLQVGSVDLASQINTNFGVSRTTTTGSGKKKKTTKKDAETYYSEIYSAAEKYMSNFQVLNDVSLQQELAYWTAVQGQLEAGTQAWYDATKQIKSLQQDIAEAEAEAVEAEARAAEAAKQAAAEKLKTHASVQSDILGKYKVYYKVSAKAEMDYWDLARQQFEVGTDERIEADQKYLEARQDWYDQRRELDEDYAENSKKINEELADNVKELEDAYKDAVASRKQDILSSMNLFESWDATGYNADTLLYNLKTQVAGLTLWEQQLEELGKKNLSKGLLDELKEMGPDAAANIYSLNQMTAAQLDEYSRLWEQKNALAMSQAVKDNESLRLETNTEITTLRLDAQSELDALNAEYRAAIAELNTGISGELASLVSQAGNIGEDAVSGLIAGIGKAANSVEMYNSTTQIVSQVSGQLRALKQEGEMIGKSTLDGILAGMTDYTKIQESSKKVVQSIKRAMDEAAEIHSPARLFRRETGPQIPAGVALGMEDNTKQAEKSAKDMMQDTLAAAQEEMKRQQAELQLQMGALDFSGISRLNRLTEQYQPQAPVVNVDMKDVLEMMQDMVLSVGNMAEEIKNLKMVIYPDVMAGQM
ncbi:MAG: phage tail tape measure protein [Lachnospiraceae bacterium]|nr:phage tail tape measure protein [Lachnospiraceae bacterium]